MEFGVYYYTLHTFNSKHGKNQDSVPPLNRILTVHEPRHASSYSLKDCTCGRIGSCIFGWTVHVGSKRGSKRGSKKVYVGKKEKHCGMGKYYLHMYLVSNTPCY
jgi:hypothetical protein